MRLAPGAPEARHILLVTLHFFSLGNGHSDLWSAAAPLPLLRSQPNHQKSHPEHSEGSAFRFFGVRLPRCRFAITTQSPTFSQPS
jgi:hypothetical protein